MGMKRTAWLTRKVLVRGIAALATGGAAIALVYGIATGSFKAGFGADETITKSEKRDKQGNITETTTTTTAQDAKTLWDWLSLLGVPFSLAILGYVLQQLQQTRAEQQAKVEKEIADQRAKVEKEIADQQAKAEKEIASQRTKTEKEIAESNQGEEALQNYLDRLSDLLIDKNVIAIAVKLQHLQKDFKDFICNQQNSVLRLPIELQETIRKEVELVNAAKDVIQARTLSILRRLGQDGERKGDVIQFLIEAEVISKLNLNFSGADLSGVKLSGADLNRANLSSANLSRANLSRANLSRANLSSANLSDADLSGANLSDADLSSANLSRANLSSANLSDADLRGANLSDANLFNANFSDADFVGADLRKANLHSADLVGAELRYTKLLNACFFNADLSGADLSDAENWTEQQFAAAQLCNTILPQGCNLNPNRDCAALGISLDPSATDSPK